MWSVSRSARVSAAEAVPPVRRRRRRGGRRRPRGFLRFMPPHRTAAPRVASPATLCRRDDRPPRRPATPTSPSTSPRTTPTRPARCSSSSARSGVEQRDATTLGARRPSGKVTLVASFERHEDAARRDRRAAGGRGRRASRRSSATRGATSGRSTSSPSACAPGVVVRPPWREHEAAPGEHVVVLEPGRAFGTGLHETTSLVAEVLAGDAPRGRDGARRRAAGAASSRSSRWRSGRRARGPSTSIPTPSPSPARTPSATAWPTGSTADDDARRRGRRDRYPVVLANIEAKTLVELAPAARRARGARRPPRPERHPRARRSPRSQLEDVRRAFARAGRGGRDARRASGSPSAAGPPAVTRAPIPDLAPGERTLEGAVAHYLARVLRLRGGRRASSPSTRPRPARPTPSPCGPTQDALTVRFGPLREGHARAPRAHSRGSRASPRATSATPSSATRPSSARRASSWPRRAGAS